MKLRSFQETKYLWAWALLGIIMGAIMLSSCATNPRSDLTFQTNQESVSRTPQADVVPGASCPISLSTLSLPPASPVAKALRAVSPTHVLRWRRNIQWKEVKALIEKHSVKCAESEAWIKDLLIRSEKGNYRPEEWLAYAAIVSPLEGKSAVMLLAKREDVSIRKRWVKGLLVEKHKTYSEYFLPLSSKFTRLVWRKIDFPAKIADHPAFFKSLLEAIHEANYPDPMAWQASARMWGEIIPQNMLGRIEFLKNVKRHLQNPRLLRNVSLLKDDPLEVEAWAKKHGYTGLAGYMAADRGWALTKQWFKDNLVTLAVAYGYYLAAKSIFDNIMNPQAPEGSGLQDRLNAPSPPPEMDQNFEDAQFLFDPLMPQMTETRGATPNPCDPEGTIKKMISKLSDLEKKDKKILEDLRTEFRAYINGDTDCSAVFSKAITSQ